MSSLAIMQPYFLPYIGYFQLMAAVDQFVVYDDIEYTKKGWINRNRYLLNGAARSFNIALQDDADTLDIVQRRLAGSFRRDKLLNQLREAYRKAPHFAQGLALLERCVMFDDDNLFHFLLHALTQVRDCLRIDTPLIVSSSVPSHNHQAKGQDRVLALCRTMKAELYVNPPGGRALYEASAFERHGLSLKFLLPRLHPYPQFDAGFVPGLSIIDALMFNPADRVRELVLDHYDYE